MATTNSSPWEESGSGENVTLYLILTDANLKDKKEEEETDIIFIAIVVSTISLLLILLTVTLGICLFHQRTGRWPKPFQRSRQSSSNFESQPSPMAGKERSSLYPSVNAVAQRRDVLTSTVTQSNSVCSVAKNISNNLDHNVRVPSHYKTETRTITSSSDTLTTKSELSKKSSKLYHTIISELNCIATPSFPSTYGATFTRQELPREKRNYLKRSFSMNYRLPSQKQILEPRLNRTRCSFSEDRLTVLNFRHFHNGEDLECKNTHPFQQLANQTKQPDDVSDSSAFRNLENGNVANLMQNKASDHHREVLQFSSSELSFLSFKNEKAIESHKWRLQQNLQKNDKCLGLLSNHLYKNDQGLLEVFINLNRKKSFGIGDDRTESQRTVVKPVVTQKRNDSYASEDDADVEESSDTESMSGSACTLSKEDAFSYKVKKPRHHSEGEHELLSASTRSERKPVKGRSNGWDSEPEFETTQTQRGIPRQWRLRSTATQNVREIPLQLTKDAFLRKNSYKDFKKNTVSLRDEKAVTTSKKSFILSPYESASLKSPVCGTVIEVPIYSKGTWSGPSAKAKNRQTRRAFQRPCLENMGCSFSKSSRTNKHIEKLVQTNQDFRIGGDGRYFCEYGSLPVDLSKLPKELVAKIGGQPHRLLEPIEKLNFDQLCRPVPTLSDSQCESSNRRLMAEKLDLPLDHKDREVLSNTYEYEATGLVMTEL